MKDVLLLATAIALAGNSAMSTGAHSQQSGDYPNRTIRVVVPAVLGGRRGHLLSSYAARLAYRSS
jgi:tripartite-type tricarboxylate transporter receptor subunit TctC